MPVYSIARDALTNGQPLTLEQARQWCAQLEAGSVLYFPESPVPLATEDLNFLLGLCQSSGRFHKNIAYKPARDRLSGAGAKIGARAPTEQTPCSDAAVLGQCCGLPGRISRAV